MCSVVESDPVEGKKAGKRRSKDEKVGKGQCTKCSEGAVVLARNGYPLCKVCFLDYIVHKFRATIGKARVVRQGEKVLLAVSGGSSSSAMLDLVVRGLSKHAVKKLRFQPGVVYIDEGELLGRSVDERQVIWESVKNLADKAGFPFHFVSLEEMFLVGENMKDLAISDDAPRKSSSLMELFDNVDTMTAKEDLLSHFHRWRLLKIAKEHGYDRVMVGDCSTNLSVRILSNVAQGRGSQLPFNIGFEDNRSDISILRPMREFTKKEIGFYNRFNQVTSFSIPSFGTKASFYASVDRLTQEFILDLQATFPSTVSTVLRTGDKLTSSDISTALNECCSFCSAPLEGSRDLAGGSGDLAGGSGDLAGGSGDLAGDLAGGSGDLAGGSGDLAGGCGALAGDDGGCCSGSVGATGTKNDGCCGGGIKIESYIGAGNDDHLLHHFSTTLCYGCKLTYNDLNGRQHLLPKFVTDNASKTFRRTAMKEEIKEFLIDD